MAEPNKNIPTLTNIVHVGDASMLNHFDSLQVNDQQDEDIDTSSLVENASEFENNEVNEIPVIKLEEATETELPEQDFSEAMQLDSKNTYPSADPDELREKIDQAINESLLGIEAHLKEKLYRKFGI